WNIPEFDWSPDGKWIVYAANDNDFNKDVHIIAADGSGTPYNLSRHPFTESNPVWSPDGTMIAFAGRRASGDPGGNVAIVNLRLDDDEKTAYDRKLEKALDKMKGRPKTGDAKEPAAKQGGGGGVAIDFDRLHERVRRIDMQDGGATNLFWSPDSKKLA